MIDKIKTADIINYENNPRKIQSTNFNQLTESISHFGFVNPITIWEKNNMIISGHQRFNAIAEKYDELYHIKVGDIGLVFPEENISLKSEEEVKALNISLNKIQGEFDFEILSQTFKNLEENSFDLTLTGFEQGEVDDIKFIYLDGEDFLSSIPKYKDEHIDLRNGVSNKYFDNVADEEYDDSYDIDEYELDDEREVDKSNSNNDNEEEQTGLADDESYEVEHTNNEKHYVCHCRELQIPLSKDEFELLKERYFEYVSENDDEELFILQLMEGHDGN
ncbi:MAG: hypothetical protein BZ138_07880 [Methanosphaera sp. rholeuAM270]|nr:MAG: hypothetical protein BZ138_07880 [Methanosphaera sp. rholeuAM270]